MKIKILHVQETIASGGVERRRLSLSKYLDKDKFEQKIICTHAVGNIVDEIKNQGVEIFVVGNLDSPFQWSQHKKVQKIIEEYQPDIIHGAVFEGVTMAAINGFIKKVPVIIIEETSDPQNRSWRGNFLMKIFSKISHKIIGVSEGVSEEYLKGKLKISSEKVFLVNNGVAIPREVSNKELVEAKIQWGISPTDFIIGSIGRMLQDEHKRFTDLIKAFAVFAKDKTNAKLLLVGDGIERAVYEKLARELEVEHKVIFVGYQSDVTLFYKMMNVFSLVSAREAFGLVLAEAMLNRLPVVATRVGGMKYIVDHNETGVLVERFNIDEISNAFIQIYNDKELGQKMGQKGFIKATREYTEQTYVNKVQDLYFRLLNTKKN